MQRDGFACQSCGSTTETLNVHHKQYRAGAAPWEYTADNLVTLCHKCHKAEHSGVKRQAFNIYLAGKIGKHDWRHELVKNLRNLNYRDKATITNPNGFTTLGVPGVVRGGHHYAGPFFLSCDHSCAHVPGHHGFNINGCTESAASHSELQMGGRGSAYFHAIEGIEACDVLFAWIDSVDCYGTIAEIGYACALAKPYVLIGFSQKFDDLWFVERMALATGIYSNAVEAFDSLIPK